MIWPIPLSCSDAVAVIAPTMSLTRCTLSTISPNDLSRWCLVIAIAAIGMKTQLKELATVGWKPIALMVGETVFLAVLVLAVLRWGPA